MAKSVARNVISCRAKEAGESSAGCGWEALSDSLGAEMDPSERLISAEVSTATSACSEFAELPDAWRQALVLAGTAGHGVPRYCGTAGGDARAQVKTWLHRARAKLLELMADDEGG